MLSQIGRYAALLSAMVMEGPLVTIGAGTAAHFGPLNVYAVFTLAVVGDFAADAVYFAIGRASTYGRLKKVWRYLRRKSGYEYWRWFEDKIRRHAIMGIALIKLAPAAPGPGLAATGAAGVPLRTFLFASLLVAIPKSAVFVAVGYFFGYAVDELRSRFYIGFLVLVTAVPAAILVYIVYRRVRRRRRTAA